MNAPRRIKIVPSGVITPSRRTIYRFSPNIIRQRNVLQTKLDNEIASGRRDNPRFENFRQQRIHKLADQLSGLMDKHLHEQELIQNRIHRLELKRQIDIDRGILPRPRFEQFRLNRIAALDIQILELEQLLDYDEEITPPEDPEITEVRKRYREIFDEQIRPETRKQIMDELIERLHRNVDKGKEINDALHQLQVAKTSVGVQQLKTHLLHVEYEDEIYHKLFEVLNDPSGLTQFVSPPREILLYRETAHRAPSRYTGRTSFRTPSLGRMIYSDFDNYDKDFEDNMEVDDIIKNVVYASWNAKTLIEDSYLINIHYFVIGYEEIHRYPDGKPVLDQFGNESYYMEKTRTPTTKSFNVRSLWETYIRIRECLRPSVHVHGSDQFEGNNGEIDYTQFEVLTPKNIALANLAKSKTRIDLDFEGCELFKVKDIECKKDGDCVLAVIRYALDPRIAPASWIELFPQKIPTAFQLRNQLNLGKEGIRLNQLILLADYFKIKINAYEYIEHMERAKDSVKLIDTYGTGEYEINLLFEQLGTPKAHCLYLAFIAPKPVIESEPELDEYEERILSYDIETYWDANKGNKLCCYGASWISFDLSNPPDDFAELEPITPIFMGGRPDEPLEKFLDFLEATPPNIRYTLVGFNNARFDNLALAGKACDRGMLTQIFLANNELKSISIGRHKSLDLAKIIPAMSLEKACGTKGFNTSPMKLVGFSHSIPQEAFASGGIDGLNKWIDDNRALCEKYNRTDVLCLSSLIVKSVKAVEELTGMNYITTGCQTAGSLAWKIVTKKWKEYKENNPTLPPIAPKVSSFREVDQFFRCGDIGGRVQNFMMKKNTEQPYYKSIRERVKMVDVASLYPSVMIGINRDLIDKRYNYGRFPTIEDESFPVMEYQEGYLGIYFTTIISQPYPNVVPLKVKGKPLDWTYRKPFSSIISSVEIECIRAHGGVVNVYFGHYWKHSTDKMFDDFIIPFAQCKDLQDNNKAKGLPFNVALRSICKIQPNSLSGKMGQRNHDDVIKLCRSVKDVQDAMDCMTNKNKAVEIIELNYETSIVAGKKTYDEAFSKKSKPAHIMTFIHAFARLYMYEFLISKYECMYMDTDSMLMREDVYKQFRLDYPQLEPAAGTDGKLGDFKEELGENEGCDIYLFTAKCYSIVPYNKEDKIISETSKNKFKGINMYANKLILNPIEDKKKKLINRLEIDQSRPIHNIYTTPDQSKIIPLIDGKTVNCGLLFEQLYTHKTAQLVVGQIARNSKRMNMKQRYLIKTITLPTLTPEDDGNYIKDLSEDQEWMDYIWNQINKRPTQKPDTKPKPIKIKVDRIITEDNRKRKGVTKDEKQFRLNNLPEGRKVTRYNREHLKSSYQSTLKTKELHQQRLLEMEAEER